MKVSTGGPGTLLACTSELTTEPAMDSNRLSGTRFSSGATTPTTSMARSSRLRVIWARTFWMRLRGSTTPMGAAMFTPANLLPPAGSESERTFTGTAMGSDATGMPLASW